MTSTTEDRARDLVDELVGRGASFDFRPASGALPRSFVYAVPRGADKWHCRRLVMDAKGDTAVWGAVLDEVEARYGGRDAP